MTIKSVFDGKNSQGPPPTTEGVLRVHLCDVQQAVSPRHLPRREPLTWSTEMAIQYESRKLTLEELIALHSLPNDALATAQEAAAFLRLKYATLAWYRCNGGGPAFVRVGPKLIRYRMGDLRNHAKNQAMGEGMRKVGEAMLAARTNKAGN